MMLSTVFFILSVVAAALLTIRILRNSARRWADELPDDDRELS